MKNKYQTGYSTRSLMIKEFDAIISSVNDIGEFIAGREKVDINIIPVNSENSKKKVLAEVLKRVRNVGNKIFWNLFLNANPEDKSLILFYAICKSYQLIPDFVLDVVLNKWYNMDYELSSYDFKNFIYKLSDTHPELEGMSDKNLSNISGATLKVLREVGMLKKNTLVQVEYDQQILKEIVNNGDSWFLEVLLLNENERKEIIEA
ncbi:BrxA family protein [Carboxylicivirga sp. N1Y90]|uniref:BrxA family protein n=1 Tax=Carboxylicivirga fragile TaxID=3417571 RepID=UPI003D3484D7|nr:DUF1819 family protein [Marinilabiliaceae bacterium N1Y90]